MMHDTEITTPYTVVIVHIMAALELVKELQPLQLEGVEETGEELGRGSYGVVFEVKVNMVRCAGKRIHDAIIGVK